MNPLIRHLIENWKTSLCGIVAVISVVLWTFQLIDTNEFLSVLGFALGGGLMLARDLKLNRK